MALRAPDFKPSPQFYVSLGAALVSSITGGRKTYLHNKLADLRKHKIFVEQRADVDCDITLGRQISTSMHSTRQSGSSRQKSESQGSTHWAEGERL